MKIGNAAGSSPLQAPGAASGPAPAAAPAPKGPTLAGDQRLGASGAARVPAAGAPLPPPPAASQLPNGVTFERNADGTGATFKDKDGKTIVEMSYEGGEAVAHVPDPHHPDVGPIVEQLLASKVMVQEAHGPRRSTNWH